MYLGIDLGTSSVKLLLVDETQRVVAEASSPLGVSRPHPLWSGRSRTGGAARGGDRAVEA
jgi:xylulokinase